MIVIQIDCFNRNIYHWNYLGIWPAASKRKYYKYYMNVFIVIFCVIYDLLLTINFGFIPRQLDSFIEEMIFYFTEMAVLSKVVTFYFMHDKIEEMLKMLEGDTFKPKNDDEVVIIDKAKKFNVGYFNIVAVVSLVSWGMNNIIPFILHFVISIPLKFPICSYSFLTADMRQYLQYPLYIYQSTGVYFHVWYNVTIDTFILGLMILGIGQLDILDKRLRKVTDVDDSTFEGSSRRNKITCTTNSALIVQLNGSIQHFGEIIYFCSLIQQVFSITLFIQFSMASTIICVCLFRFTMPAPIGYYIFLATYMFVMITQILVPCWFGTRIIDKSNMLGQSIYDCDWTNKSRSFKINMRLFVERTSRPLTLIGGKMFLLSLTTFTAIMNTAYSFFTLLRHMQSRQ